MGRKKQCLCSDKNFESDLFTVIPLYNMTYPLVKYFMCNKCGKIYETIKKGNSFVEYSKKQEKGE